MAVLAFGLGEDAVPGMVAAVQTFGELAHWHPHRHAIVTDGVAPADRNHRRRARRNLRISPKLLLDEERISAETVAQMRSWQHSGNVAAPCSRSRRYASLQAGRLGYQWH